MSLVKKCARILRRTPLHPQWLLGQRKPPKTIASASGLVLDIGSADRWIKQHLPSDTTYWSLDYPVTVSNFYESKPDVFGDAGQLPFADNTFNSIICLEVIEHLPEPLSAMTEIARTLKPGGEAWVSMPFMYPIHNAPFDFQRFTEHGLRENFGKAELDILEIYGEGHAIRTAGLLLALSIAGGAYEEATSKLRRVLFVPALLSVLIVNISALLASLIFPDWKHMPTNYHVHLRKPRATL